MKIIPLNHGTYGVDKQKNFRLLSSENGNDETVNDLKIAVCPFLILVDEELILLDTGLGFMDKGIPLLLRLIEGAGYNASQITKVLISHLHKDHIDGIGYFKENVFVPNFPNAVIYIQKRELDFALEQHQNPSYNFDVLNQLKSISNVMMLDADKGKITNKIFYEVSGGHTPFHQVFWIKEDDKIVFYGADNLPKRSYLELHIAYKTDYDGKRAMDLRKKWGQEGKKQHWKILLYHDIEQSVLEL
jgi:glyoxylase-like metal-dependent hydrolase (beta-lactamase superfamily II)